MQDQYKTVSWPDEPLLGCGCPAQHVTDCGHQEGCSVQALAPVPRVGPDGAERCISCGSKRGVWTDDQTWTCFRCGDEWTDGP